MKDIDNDRRRMVAFDALHAVYHERDFRVRVNDATISMVRSALSLAVGEDKLSPALAKPDLCPACVAGFDYEAADAIFSALKEPR